MIFRLVCRADHDRASGDNAERPVTGKHLAVSVPAALGSLLVGYEYDLVPQDTG